MVEWLPLAAPGTPLPALASCRSLAIVGGSDADAPALVRALAAHGCHLEAAPDDTADVLVLMHGLGNDTLKGAFADLTRLATRRSKPALLVGVATSGTSGAGLAGLVKTAALEWEAACKCITLDPGLPALDGVAAELARGGIAREVWLMAPAGASETTGRRVRIRVPAALGKPARAITPGPWIISGGARGVTAACAIELARAGARKIVLLGRSALDDEPVVCHDARDEAALKRALIAATVGTPDLRGIGRQVSAILAQREVRGTIAALQAAGAEVRYSVANVARGDEVRRVVNEARAAWGPIRGIVHGAGVLADRRLGEKTADQFASVLEPKLDGAAALLGACTNDPLEQICFFSSVAAQSGNPGQSDYAAANAMLDQLAVEEQARRGGACHVVSIAWGPWAGGMVTESLAKHFSARGITLIPVEGGARAFVDELARGDGSQVVLGCGLDQVSGSATERLRIDVAELPMLDGHRIERAAVLPMTMALDALLGIGRTRIGPACEVHDLRLLHGLMLDDGHAELEGRTAEAPSGHGILGSLVHPTGRPAYQAELRPAIDGPTPAPTRLADRNGDLPAACRRPYDGSLFHGPPFQVIREIVSCTPSSIAARLATAGDMGWPDVWQLDPAALDGALQLLRVWGIAQGGRPSLPTSIGHCRPWAGWPRRGEVGCTLQCRRDNPFKLSADALFFELDTGRPLLSLDGIVMHVQAG